MAGAGARRAPQVLRVAVTSVLQAGAQPIRSVRRTFDPNYRRSERWLHRRLARATVVAGVVVLLAVAVGVAFGTWVPLVLVLGGFALEAVVLAWRARPSRGRQDHWPVGDLRDGPDALTREDHFARRAAKYGSLFKTNFLGTPTACVVDLGQATRLLREHADALGPPWGHYERFVPGGSIRGAPATRNAELRRLYARTLTVGLVRSWEPALARRTAAQLGALAEECAATAGGVNPRAAVRDLVLGVWCELFLGAAPGTPEHDEVVASVTALDPDRRLYDHGLPDDEVSRVLDRLGELVRSAAMTRDRALVPETLADRFEAVQPGALDDPGLMRNLLYTVITTRDDVAGLLVWLLWYLTDQPEWVARVRADPPGAIALADRIVSETLRLEQSEFVMRRVKHEFRFDDTVVPQGWYVRACIREIHRDPATFPRAAAFDPDRFVGDGCTREVYAPFGIDHRFCLGEHLTRTVARVFTLETAQGFDAATLADGPPELSMQRHWSPNSQWSLELRPRIPPGALA